MSTIRRPSFSIEYFKLIFFLTEQSGAGACKQYQTIFLISCLVYVCMINIKIFIRLCLCKKLNSLDKMVCCEEVIYQPSMNTRHN